MLNQQSFRARARSLALCALALVLVLALPSLARPDTASAQFCGSSGFSVGGSSGFSGSNCGYGGCGSSILQSCGSSIGQYGPSSCGLFNSSCSGGSGLFGGNGIGGGPSCVGMQLTAGESCSNGSIICSQGSSNCQAGGYGPQSSCPPNAPSYACGAASNPNCQPNISSSLCPGGYQPPVAGNNMGFGTNVAASNPVIGENYGSSYGGSSAGNTTPDASLISCGSYGQVPASDCPTASASTGGTTNSSLNFGASSSGLQIVYPSGWNIVAGPQGTSFGSAGGSLYTLQAGDSGYETAALGGQLKAGDGYWLYSSGVQASIPAAPGASATVQLPAGQWVLIGNPGSTVATVNGADEVLTFDPLGGSYKQTTQLQPGQGAWAMSNAGGSATVTSQ